MTTPKKIPVPTPIVVRTICSLCDEPWESHSAKPSTIDCINLLKAKLATAQFSRQPYFISNTAPSPLFPTYGTTSTVANYTVQYRTPDDGDGMSVAS